MSDFINDLKTDIVNSMPDISQDWAEFNSIILLATILHNARIIEKDKPLKLNLIMLMVGPAGIKKSLPMTAWTYPIIHRTSELTERDLLLPSRSSVEGFIKYLTSKEKEDPPRNVGIIIRDEFSGLFKQLRRADWQADGMEFISEMYDGIFQKRVTTSHGVSKVDNLYANLITATTPYFVSKLDSDFFIQGTGNRFLYCYFGLEDYEINEIQPQEYFLRDWGNKRDEKLNIYAEKLANLYKRNLQDIYVTPDAGKLYAEYKKQCELEWKTKGLQDPMGWEYHPIKRYPELALKLSGIYAVSSYIDNLQIILRDDGIIVRDRHMQRSIDLVERNRKNFSKIVEIKRKYVKRKEPYSIENEAKAMLLVLASAKDKMLPPTDWMDRYGGTTNRQKKQELIRHCVARGWVKRLVYSDVNYSIRKKYDMYNTSIIYQYVSGL